MKGTRVSFIQIMAYAYDLYGTDASLGKVWDHYSLSVC